MAGRRAAAFLFVFALVPAACTSSDGDAGPPEPASTTSPPTTKPSPPPTTGQPPPPPTTQAPTAGTLGATLQVGGAPLAGVEVFLGVTPPGGASEARFSCTDDNGVVSFDDVPFAASLIAITGPGLSGGCSNPLFLDRTTDPAHPLVPTTVLDANSSISGDRDLGTVEIPRLPGSSAAAREHVAFLVGCLRDGDAGQAFYHFDRYLGAVVDDRVAGATSADDDPLINRNTDGLQFWLDADQPCSNTGPVGDVPVLIDWTFIDEEERPTVTLTEAGAEPRRVLAFAPQPGAKADTTMRQVLSQTQVIDGEVFTDITTIVDMAFTTELAAVDDEGNFTVVTTTEAVTVQSDDALTQRAVEGALQEQIGATDATLIAPNGQVLAVESSFDADFAQALASTVAPLPAEPVGVGAVWVVETTFEALGVNTSATTTYTITAIDGSLVTLAVESVQDVDVAELFDDPAVEDAEVTLTQTGSGTTTWDLTTGDTVESTFALEQVLIATAEFDGVESTLEQVTLTAFKIPSPGPFGPPEGTEAFVVRDLIHVDGTVEYEQDPPVGGPHAAEWVTCGYYGEPVSTEMAVHSMEHGAVWITYEDGLPADQVAALQDLAEAPYVLVSPYEGLDTAVVASAWGVQLRLDSALDPRLGEFVDWYAAGPQTPEPGAPC